MSKVFIPHFSPSPQAPEFHRPESPGRQNASALSLEWPCLQSREKELRWNQTMREREEEILKRAREKALLIEREAYEKGFAQGERDGMQLGQKKMEAVLESLQRIREEVERLPRILDQETEEEMVRVIFAVTRKILHQDSFLPEEAVREVLRAAYRHVVDPRGVTVHLSPGDYEYLFTHPADLPCPGGEESGAFRMVADSAISRGGCLLETSFGQIDATLDGQLDQIITSVRKTFQGEAKAERLEP